MAFNSVQFQPDMSIPESLSCCGTAAKNKVPFVAAVSINANDHPLYRKLNWGSGFTLVAIGKWDKAIQALQTGVISGGLGCFAAATEAACLHLPIMVGDRKPRDLPQLKWVSTVLGNLKTPSTGAFYSLKYRCTATPTSQPLPIASTTGSICAASSPASSSMSRCLARPRKLRSGFRRNSVSNQEN